MEFLEMEQSTAKQAKPILAVISIKFNTEHSLFARSLLPKRGTLASTNLHYLRIRVDSRGGVISNRRRVEQTESQRIEGRMECDVRINSPSRTSTSITPR